MSVSDPTTLWLSLWEEQEGVGGPAVRQHRGPVTAVFARIRREYDLDTVELRQLIRWWWAYKRHKFTDPVHGPNPKPLFGCVEEFRQWVIRHQTQIAEYGLEEVCQRQALEFTADEEWVAPAHWGTRHSTAPASPL